MSEPLSIPFCLGKKLSSPGIESLLRFCFEELECSRSSPECDRVNGFRYMTNETTPDIISGATIDESITAIRSSEEGSIWFWYNDIGVGFHINTFSHKYPDVPITTLSIDSRYTKPYNNNDPSLIYEFVLELYDYLSPSYVYGDTHLIDRTHPTTEGVKNRRLEEIFWVNGFGPEMATNIGRERLGEAPAWRIDDCDDGGIFLWTSPLPYSSSRTDYELQTYFGLR